MNCMCGFKKALKLLHTAAQAKKNKKKKKKKRKEKTFNKVHTEGR